MPNHNFWGFLIFFVPIVHGEATTKSAVLKYCSGRDVGIGGYETRKAQSGTECGILCLQKDHCMSAEFVKENQTCQLSENAISETQCTSMTQNKDTDIIHKEYPCYHNQPFANGQCQCGIGYKGVRCETPPPRDCSANHGEGILAIYPYKDRADNVTVHCTDNMLLIFAATKGMFSEHAYDDWSSYKTGFEVSDGSEYWIGNEVLHQTTARMDHNYTLKFHVCPVDDSCSTHLYYHTRVSNETSNYTFSYTGSLIESGDAQIIPSGNPFRTIDHNEINFCVSMNGPFWYPEDCPAPSPFGGKYIFNFAEKYLSNFTAFVY